MSDTWEPTCVGCDTWRWPDDRDDLGLCTSCAAKLDRDMIRARDWEYSKTARATPAEGREALRQRIIAHYGARYELIVPPRRRKKRRSRP